MLYLSSVGPLASFSFLSVLWGTPWNISVYSKEILVACLLCPVYLRFAVFQCVVWVCPGCMYVSFLSSALFLTSFSLKFGCYIHWFYVHTLEKSFLPFQLFLLSLFGWKKLWYYELPDTFTLKVLCWYLSFCI